MMLLNVFGTGKLCKKLQNMNNKCKTDMITTEKKKRKHALWHSSQQFGMYGMLNIIS